MLHFGHLPVSGEGSQIFDIPDHFLRRHYLGDQDQSFENLTQRLIRGVEHNAAMIAHLCRDAKEVLIAGDDYASFSAREL